MGPDALAQVLCNLKPFYDTNLLVGFDTSDDACVYKISEELALVQTVDFFPPIVDDPYTFGQIAAANAMSDIYAMGATPTLAMNLLCCPSCLPPEAVGAILEGGADKVREAGAIVAGGHTIEDAEPKYGLCVSGFVHPKKVYKNNSANIGDVLLLTKPLGSGILTTAAKADIADSMAYLQAVDYMKTLNRAAAEVLKSYSVSACTDVTGFGLMGHAYEMAAGTGLAIRLFASELPILPTVKQLAEMGIIPAGAHRNYNHLKNKVSIKSTLERSIRDILCDPQTSGGLLAAVPAKEAPEVLKALLQCCPHTKIIGEVTGTASHAIMVE